MRRPILTAYIGLVAYLLWTPAIDAPIDDKLAHVLMFTGLSALIWWNLTLDAAERIVVAIAWATLAAIATEIGQAFVPGRVADGMDLLADLLGVGVGVGLGHFAARLRDQARTRHQ